MLKQLNHQILKTEFCINCTIGIIYRYLQYYVNTILIEI